MAFCKDTMAANMEPNRRMDLIWTFIFVLFYFITSHLRHIQLQRTGEPIQQRGVQFFSLRLGGRVDAVFTAHKHFLNLSDGRF